MEITRENVHGSFTPSYWLWVVLYIVIGAAIGLGIPQLLGCEHTYIELNPDADGDGDAESDGSEDVVEICNNWVDDDADGRVDCADPDCASPACAVCGNGLVEPGEDCEPGTMSPCTTTCGSTGVRSCDGFCRWLLVCEPSGETCNDADDDCDGYADEGLGDCGCDILEEFESGLGDLEVYNNGTTECPALSTVTGYTGMGALIPCGAIFSAPLGVPLRFSARVRATSTFNIQAGSSSMDVEGDALWHIIDVDIGWDGHWLSIDGALVLFDDRPEFLAVDQPGFVFFTSHDMVIDDVCIRD